MINTKFPVVDIGGEGRGGRLGWAQSNTGGILLLKLDEKN